MTKEELERLEDAVRQHKAKGASSNIVLKLNQVETLLRAARSGLPTADVFEFNIAAEFKKQKMDATDKRYIVQWADAKRQYKLQKDYLDRKKQREQRREKLISKWKTFAGYERKIPIK